MAPAVEIDPRLLRQLEEEYESLKNDTERPRVDFEKWIRQRLKEAKAAGLVRLAKGTPASHTLKVAAAAKAAGMAPPKTAFGSSYNPNKYTRKSSDPPVAINDTAKGRGTATRTKERSTEGTIAAAVGTGTGGVAAYVPLVFKPSSPRPGNAGASSSSSGTAGGTTARATKSPAKKIRPPSSSSSSNAEAARRQAAAASAAATGRDPNLPWFAQRPSAYVTPGTAGQPLVMSPSKAAWNDDTAIIIAGHVGLTGGHGTLKPGPNPAADSVGYAPAVLAAAQAAAASKSGVGGVGGGEGEASRTNRAPEGLSKTVQGVGDRVRRMAEAVALAQKDMASRLAEASDRGDDVDGGRMGKMGTGGSARGGRSKTGDGFDTSTAKGGSAAGTTSSGAIKHRSELHALQTQQKALEAKNKELEEALKLQAKRAAEQERKAATARKAAAAAKAEMTALVEERALRQRRAAHSSSSASTSTTAPTTTTAAGGENRQKGKSAVVVSRRSAETSVGGVRASFPVSASDQKRLSSESGAGAGSGSGSTSLGGGGVGGGGGGAPQTLREAAAELLGDTIVEERVKRAEGEARELGRRSRDEDRAREDERTRQEERVKERREGQVRRREPSSQTAEGASGADGTAAAKKKRSPVKPKGPSFLDRVSARKGRSTAETETGAGTGAGTGTGDGTSSGAGTGRRRGRPAWNDSPDMVTTISGPAPPPPSRRRVVPPPPPPKYASRGVKIPAGGVAAARRRQVAERARASAAAAASTARGKNAVPAVAFGRAVVGNAAMSSTTTTKTTTGNKGDKDRDRALREAALKLLEAEVGRVLPASSTRFVSADVGAAAVEDDSFDAMGFTSSVYTPPANRAQSTTATTQAVSSAVDAPVVATTKTPSSRKAALSKTAAAAAADAAGGSSAHRQHPLQGPATGLMTLSPRPSFSEAGGEAQGDPRAEIAAMRTILDEVVAHLRMLHMASSGVGADQSGATTIASRSARSPKTPKSKSRKSGRLSRISMDFDRLSRGGGDFTTGSEEAEDDDDRPVSSSSPKRGGRGGKGSGSGSGSGSGGGGGGSGSGSGSDGGVGARASFATSSMMRLSGALVLSSLEHSRALEALREVEENEAAMRARWGLFSPKHPPPRELTDKEKAVMHRDSVVLGEAGIAAVEAEVASASAHDTTSEQQQQQQQQHTAASVAAAIAAKSLSTAGEAAARALVDEDMVARVWEARNQFVRYQSMLDDAVVSEDGPDGGDFSPVEVNEEVAERLLDSLLTDVARELGDACDEATSIVLQHEFSGGGNGGNGGNNGGVGRYGAGGRLIDDDVIGPAVERAYL